MQNNKCDNIFKKKKYVQLSQINKSLFFFFLNYGYLKIGLKGKLQINLCSGNAVNPENTIPKVSAMEATLNANNLRFSSI